MPLPWRGDYRRLSGYADDATEIWLNNTQIIGLHSADSDATSHHATHRFAARQDIALAALAADQLADWHARPDPDGDHANLGLLLPMAHRLGLINAAFYQK